ncbi:MAG: hypothetical protein WCD18_00860 [Thermosynechococcaceae cyanobacterium]
MQFGLGSDRFSHDGQVIFSERVAMNAGLKRTVVRRGGGAIVLAIAQVKRTQGLKCVIC